MKAGAVEFLTKPFQKEDLLTAIQQAFEADLRRRNEEHTIDSLQSRMETLTSREREVMEMVTAGYLNKQIADHLNLSEITVKLHRRHVMEKMRAGSIVELVRIADRVKGTK
jgi:FixJ family two-component response regulator